MCPSARRTHHQARASQMVRRLSFLRVQLCVNSRLSPCVASACACSRLSALFFANFALLKKSSTGHASRGRFKRTPFVSTLYSNSLAQSTFFHILDVLRARCRLISSPALFPIFVASRCSPPPVESPFQRSFLSPPGIRHPGGAHPLLIQMPSLSFTLTEFVSSSLEHASLVAELRFLLSLL